MDSENLNILLKKSVELMNLEDLYEKDERLLLKLEELLHYYFSQFPFDTTMLHARKYNRKYKLETAVFINNNKQLMSDLGEKDEDLTIKTDGKINVFTYWSIDETMPEIVKVCRDSILKYVDTKYFNLVILNDKNYADYVTIPKDIDISKFKKANFSDILRLLLLEKYGGFWLDATCLLTQDFYTATQQIRNNEIFYFRYTKSRIATWFIYSKPNSVIMKIHKFFFLLWLKQYNKFSNYYMYHDFVQMEYACLEQHRKIWDKMLLINPRDALSIFSDLKNDFDEKKMKNQLNNSFIHKLTYKYSGENIQRKIQFFAEVL